MSFDIQPAVLLTHALRIFVHTYSLNVAPDVWTVLENEGITDMDTLVDMTKADLRDVGVRMGDASKILRAVATAGAAGAQATQQRKQAEQQRRQAEAQRVAEQQRRQAEEQRRAEADRTRAEEQRRQQQQQGPVRV